MIRFLSFILITKYATVVMASVITQKTSPFNWIKVGNHCLQNSPQGITTTADCKNATLFFPLETDNLDQQIRIKGVKQCLKIGMGNQVLTGQCQTKDDNTRWTFLDGRLKTFSEAASCLTTNKLGKIYVSVCNPMDPDQNVQVLPESETLMPKIDGRQSDTKVKNHKKSKIRSQNLQSRLLERFCIEAPILPSQPISLALCKDNEPRQKIFLSNNKYLRAANETGNCFIVKNNTVVLSEFPNQCGKSNKWYYSLQTQFLVHSSTSKCLQAVRPNRLTLTLCNTSDKSQKFITAVI